jgi:membrane protein
MRANLWTRAGLSWPQLLKRIAREIFEDQIPGRAAELAFYFLFALFPLLLFLTSIFAHVMGERADLRAELFSYLEAVIPTPGTYALVRNTLDEVIDQRGLHFGVGLFVALWASSQAMVAIGRVLDHAYDRTVRRAYWKAQLVALCLTLAFALLTLVALVLIFWGGGLAGLLADRLALGPIFETAWRLVQWGVALVFVVIAFELIYNFAPGAMDRRRIFWSSPGAVAAVVLWLGVSLGFKTYLTHSSFYSWAYGSLGALIVLVLWFYLTGFAILIGGEINYEIVKALAEQGRPLGAPPARRGQAARRSRVRGA